MKILKTTNEFEIDSLKMHIPLELCEYGENSYKIADLVLVNVETGEALEDHKSNSYEYTPPGEEFKIYFQKVKYNFDNSEHIQLKFSSKINGFSYLDGITIRHIKNAYQQIQSADVVRFSFETFIDVNLIDVDYKKDELLSTETSAKAIDILEDCTKPSKKYGQGCNIKRNYNNKKQAPILAIYYGQRAEEKNSDIFLKWYKKDFEMRSKKNKAFREKYFSNHIIPSILRAEYNIKNAKQFKKYSDKPFNFKTLLKLDNSKKIEIYKKIISIHTTGIIILPPKMTDKNNTQFENAMIGALNIPRTEDKENSILLNYVYLQGYYENLYKDNRKRKSEYLIKLREIYNQVKSNDSIIIEQAEEHLNDIKKLFEME